ncbi:MAG: hypothetical protein ACTSPD_07510 [Promethearchaeota archaeon]
MSKNTTIKVSKKTLKRLHQFAGELTQQIGKRVTLEGAIIKLLEQKDKFSSDASSELKIDEDRKTFLALLDEVFEGAGPEDFKEYDYNDIGID